MLIKIDDFANKIINYFKIRFSFKQIFIVDDIFSRTSFYKYV